MLSMLFFGQNRKSLRRLGFFFKKISLGLKAHLSQIYFNNLLAEEIFF